MSDLERLSVVIENGHIWEVRNLVQRLLEGPIKGRTHELLHVHYQHPDKA